MTGIIYKLKLLSEYKLLTVQGAAHNLLHNLFPYWHDEPISDSQDEMILCDLEINPSSNIHQYGTVMHTVHCSFLSLPILLLFFSISLHLYTFNSIGKKNMYQVYWPDLS